MKKILKRFSAIALCMGLVMSVNSSTTFAGTAKGESTKYLLEASCDSYSSSYLIIAKGDHFNPSGEATYKYARYGQVYTGHASGRSEYTYWYAKAFVRHPTMQIFSAALRADGVSVTANLH